MSDAFRLLLLLTGCTVLTGANFCILYGMWQGWRMIAETRRQDRLSRGRWGDQ